LTDEGYTTWREDFLTLIGRTDGPGRTSLERIRRDYEKWVNLPRFLQVHASVEYETPYRGALGVEDTIRHMAALIERLQGLVKTDLDRRVDAADASRAAVTVQPNGDRIVKLPNPQVAKRWARYTFTSLTNGGWAVLCHVGNGLTLDGKPLEGREVTVTRRDGSTTEVRLLGPVRRDDVRGGRYPVRYFRSLDEEDALHDEAASEYGTYGGPPEQY